MMLRRREFLAGLGTAAALPLAARAQQRAQRVRRVAILNMFDDSEYPRAQLAEILRPLAQLGWQNGRNVQIDLRWAAGESDRAAALAKELVALQPDVVIAVGTPAVAALQRETRTIPIVFLIVSDPVGLGFVASLNRPGGNITGFSNHEGTIAGKLLSLLKRAAPAIDFVAAMYNPDTAPARGLYHIGSFEDAARSLGIEAIRAEVRSDAEIERAITAIGLRRGGLLAMPDVFNVVHRNAVIAFAIRNKVPAIFDSATFAKDGGLLQYNQANEDFRRVASYVDRILRGAKPGELPVELPTFYRFVINLKTAKAIGLDVSPDMISIADEVIE